MTDDLVSLLARDFVRHCYSKSDGTLVSKQPRRYSCLGILPAQRPLPGVTEWALDGWRDRFRMVPVTNTATISAGEMVRALSSRSIGEHLEPIVHVTTSAAAKPDPPRHPKWPSN
jgi:hypothetical protein